MKRVINILGILALLFCVVGCATPDDGADVVKAGGSDMTLYAQSPSRTTNDGIYTLWSKGDKINVFHSLSGDGGFLNDNAFALQEGTENGFYGNLNAEGALVSDASYDWYACYPYRASLAAPNGKGAAYVIGSLSTLYQTQSGNNSTFHLAGEHMPLVGVAKCVKAGDAPSVTMKNAASMVELELTNNHNQNIVVKSISFSVENCNLVGSFEIDFRDIEKIVYTPILGEVSDTATLRVDSGASIATSSSASFYMAIAPFVALSGAKVNISVQLQNSAGEEHIYAKSKTLTSQLTFTAGKSKKISLNYASDLTITEIPVDGLPPFDSGGESVIFRTRAMTYNVHCCKGPDDVVDYKRVADVITSVDVDVVALQELDSMTTRYPGQYQLQNIADHAGMYATFGAAIERKGGKYGVGVLTKEKPLSYYCVPLPCSSEPRVMLVVELAKYYFCSTHFSLLADYRSQAVEIIAAEAKKLNKPMIVAGDLNAQRPEASMVNLAESFYIFEKFGSPNTFPSSGPVKEIDYISLYKGRGAVAEVCGSWVLFTPIISDHMPTVVDMVVCE